MGIQNSPSYLSFFIPILKFTTKTSPVKDDRDYICRTYGALIFYVNLFCRDSALRASSPAYKLPLLLLFLNSLIP